MNEIFGVSMTWIMIVLIALLVVCLSATVWVAMRRPVVFKLGIRNIPRRQAQTVLIVIGLMLSTLIIAAALGTGDTIDHSATLATYKTLGHADVLVVYSRAEDGEGSIGTSLNDVIPQDTVQQIETAFADTDLIDGVMPVLIKTVPAVLFEGGPPAGGEDLITLLQQGKITQAEPTTYLAGIDPARLADFGGLKNLDGDEIALADLGPNDVVISEEMADALDADVGDAIGFTYNNESFAFTVRAVAEDSPMSGRFDTTTPGMVIPLARLQELTGQQGEVTTVAVSNRGGLRDGLKLTDQVVERLKETFQGQPLGVDPIKQDSIDLANQFASIFTTFFIVFGLFSIAVGILLIVLIFTMLAAERRPEMGMARAVGQQRRQLIQQFVAEGTGYALAAGLVGAALGVLAAIGIALAFKPLFGDFFEIEPHVTPRSMIVAYCLGVVITFITVVGSSWKISRLNIVAAIRDTPEPVNFVGGRRFFRRGSIKRGVVWFVAGIVLAVIGGAAAGASGSEDLATAIKIVLGIVGGLVVLGGLLVLGHGLQLIVQPFWGVLLLVSGVIFTILGAGNDSAFPFYLGMSLMPFGLALLLRFYGVPSRPVFSVVGLYIVVLWLLPDDVSTSLFGELDGDIEMFFLSGIFMVAGATLVVVQNLDWLLAGVSALGGLFRSKLPAVRTAVAFPGMAKGRTGMTIAMFMLIVFSLVVFSAINENFVNLLLGDEANAGWDIRADQGQANPIGDTDDFLALLRDRGLDTSAIEATGLVTTNFQVQLRQQGALDSDGEPDLAWKEYLVHGAGPSFIEESEITFQQRAVGYESDEAIIEALKTQPNVAVIDSFALGGQGGFGSDDRQFVLDDPDGDGPRQAVTSSDKTFEPVAVEIQRADGSIETITIIGVITDKISTLFGLYLPRSTAESLFTSPSITSYFVRVADPSTADETAKSIESALLINGVEATSIRDELEEQQQQNRAFLYIIQGFMGLGLIVGIAAVGVIAFRSVVERRQQIGVLRAIGFQRSLVSFSFLVETAFVVSIGVVLGTVLGIILSYNLFNSDDFTTSDVDFVIPWTIVIAILLITIIAALLMTLVPARQASRLAPAEALRYE